MKLTKEDIISYLETKDENKIQDLFRLAREAREEQFGKKMFLYGFVYFTTYCRNSCNFCYYRKENNINRYRKTSEEILSTAIALAESGIHLVDLTMGEDPVYHKENFNSVAELIKRIKKETDLPVMISPGVISREQTDSFADAGADWYALYQETHNRKLFEQLRVNQNYDERMESKLYAKTTGMLIEEGLMSGVGETNEDIADSIIEMGRVGASQIRVMSFVPQIGSPMQNVKSPDRSIELKIIALMRIMYPWALIPASLDVDGIAGLEARMNAGSNVVTSIIPPRMGFAGVAQNSKDVDDGGRTVEEVTKILENMGLQSATAEEYKEYLKVLKCRG